jgi:NTP pyrophosphatase (non-canonical NTP hydrolase)
MELNDYQEEAKKTAIYPHAGQNIIYPVLGLCGEAGEVAEKIKKAIRDEGGAISNEKKEELKKEVSDVLWYVAIIAMELGATLNEIADINIEKLKSRKERGYLGGNGDNR